MVGYSWYFGFNGSLQFGHYLSDKYSLWDWYFGMIWAYKFTGLNQVLYLGYTMQFYYLYIRNPDQSYTIYYMLELGSNVRGLNLLSKLWSDLLTIHII